MVPAPKFRWFAGLCLLLVVASAGGVRAWYLVECVGGGWYDPPVQVQGDAQRRLPDGTVCRGRTQPTELDQLADNLAKEQRFAALTPFADVEETTAHIAPGYPWLLGMAVQWSDERADWAVRWLQCMLGALTAGCYFLFARRAFHSTLIALLTGLLAAVYPFWVINTAELNDGVLATFLVGVCLSVGTRSAQTGGVFSGLVFGVVLAGLCMVRAAFLPFAIVAALWFLWRCRRFSHGWVAGVLMLVGFINGLAPWTVRNYQLFDRPVPIATTTYYHLWVGNNAGATGVTLDESAARAVLGPERVKELVDEPKQKRYDRLAHDLLAEVKTQPGATWTRRILATLAFFLGDWFKEKHLVSMRAEGPLVAEPPAWVGTHVDHILHAALLPLFALALLGWRISHRWRVYGRLGTIAAIFLPLPYIVSHAEALSGPRLPFDGILLCFAAFAIASAIPWLVRGPERAAAPASSKEK